MTDDAYDAAIVAAYDAARNAAANAAIAAYEVARAAYNAHDTGTADRAGAAAIAAAHEAARSAANAAIVDAYEAAIAAARAAPMTADASLGAASQILINTGTALYGERWQSALARDLDMSDRHMRRLASGGAKVRPGMLVDMLRIVSERQAELDAIAERLRPRTPPSRREKNPRAGTPGPEDQIK